MKTRCSSRWFLVFLVTVVLATGLSQIDYLVRERTQRRDQVVAGIAAATARDQTWSGRCWSFPYTRIVKTQKPSEKDDNKMIEVEKSLCGLALSAASRTGCPTNLNTEQIRRGLYHAVVFSGAVSLRPLRGRWRIAETRSERTDCLRRPRLIVGIGDPRGILRAPALAGPDSVSNSCQAPPRKMPNGIQAHIGGLNPQEPWSAEFELTFDLRGTQSFDVAPVGDTTRIGVHGNWPHPSFYGQFLPESRQ